MRNIILKLFILILIGSVILSFNRRNSIVKGSVNPSDGALRAFVASGTDTLSAEVQQGNFQITNVKPGKYILVLEGKPPYKNTVKDGITVADGTPADVGVIDMQQ